MMLSELGELPRFGLAGIDNEHKEVLNLIKLLDSALHEGKGKELLDKILDQLVGDIVVHCCHEEELFEATEYPGVHEHKKAHKDIITRISDIQSQCRFGVDEDLANMLYLFLKGVFLTHIQTMDRAFVPYVQEEVRKNEKNAS